MVDDARTPSFVVEEQQQLAKTGRPEDCEDEVYVGAHFVAVIDGATSKTERRWQGETGGRVAARILRAVFAHMPADTTLQQALELMTAAIRQFYVAQDVLDIVTADPTQRLIATIVLVSLYRREVWFVGDCQCLLDQQQVYQQRHVDRITAEARAFFLEAELLRGVTMDELLQHDTGREFIKPLLERQQRFQNNPAAGPYSYAVVDGFPIALDAVQVYPIPAHTQTIVLASDGYPILCNNLAQTEQALQELLQNDPLMFRAYKSTKGRQAGTISFDDRSYLRISLQPHE